MLLSERFASLITLFQNEFRILLSLITTRLRFFFSHENNVIKTIKLQAIISYSGRHYFKIVENNVRAHV